MHGTTVKKIFEIKVIEEKLKRGPRRKWILSSDRSVTARQDRVRLALRNYNDMILLSQNWVNEIQVAQK